MPELLSNGVSKYIDLSQILIQPDFLHKPSPEFAARVPKAGSAYVYSYVSVGEFVAFTIGWNLILEYVIGTSSVARGLSGYVDSLAGNQMSRFFKDIVTFDVGFLGEYPDFFSFIIVLLITALLAFGVKESSLLNNTFTSINVLTILLMFITGMLKGESQESVRSAGHL